MWVMFAKPVETNLFKTRVRLSSSIRAFIADPVPIRLPNGPPVLRRARLLVPSFPATMDGTRHLNLLASQVRQQLEMLFSHVFQQYRTVPSKRIVGSGRLISDPNRALSTRYVATLPEKDQRGLLVQRRA
jgi:hypothetical protein